MPAAKSEERALIATVAAHERWAREDDRSSATAAARAAFQERFEREVDPEQKLSPAERARRADHARKAYYKRLALRSAQARRKAKESTAAAEAAEAELAALGGERHAS